MERRAQIIRGAGLGPGPDVELLPVARFDIVPHDLDILVSVAARFLRNKAERESEVLHDPLEVVAAKLDRDGLATVAVTPSHHREAAASADDSQVRRAPEAGRHLLEGEARVLLPVVERGHDVRSVSPGTGHDDVRHRLVPPPQPLVGHAGPLHGGHLQQLQLTVGRAGRIVTLLVGGQVNALGWAVSGQVLATNHRQQARQYGQTVAQTDHGGRC